MARAPRDLGMNLHLQEIAAIVSPGAHAIVIVDQAGWHFSKGLVIPHNITFAAPASKITGTQSGREHLAVHA